MHWHNIAFSTSTQVLAFFLQCLLLLFHSYVQVFKMLTTHVQVSNRQLSSTSPMIIFCLLSYPSYLEQSLVQRRHHPNGSVASAGPPHYPTSKKQVKPSNSWGNLSCRDWIQNRKAGSCLLSEISTRKSHFRPSWGTTEWRTHSRFQI